MPNASIASSLDPCAERLDNGLTLLWQRLAHVHTVSLLARIRAGRVYESRESNGVSHLLEHLHLAVTERHSVRRDLLVALDALPGEIQAETGPDHLVFALSVVPTHVEAGAELLADTLAIRDYPPEIVDAEKRLVVNELAVDEDNLSALERRLFGAHAFGLPIGGTPASIRRLRPEAIHDFNRRAFAPDRICVALAGCFTDADLDRARTAFGRLRACGDERLSEPQGPTVPLPRLFRKAYRGRFCGVAGAFVNPPPLNPRERLALLLVEHGLTRISSPVFEQSRYGAASAYHVFTYTVANAGTHCLWFHAYTRPRDRDTVLGAILAQIAALRDEREPPAWLESARRECVFQAERCLDTPAQVAEWLAASHGRPAGETGLALAQTVELAKTAPLAELAHAAGRLLSRDRFFLWFDGRARFLDAARVRSVVDAHL